MTYMMNPTADVKDTIKRQYDQYVAASERFEASLARATTRPHRDDGSRGERDIARQQIYNTLLRHLRDGGVDMDNFEDVRNNAARLIQSALDGYVPMGRLLAAVDAIFAPC